uniref:FCP1 homology domain-containing protein n=1 Tax=viral metagenome TaxID=1070528 RepID=A0A6C0C5X5_9ZZZZ
MGNIKTKFVQNSYIFLDIDGVLNCSTTRTNDRETHMPQHDLLNNLKKISDIIPNTVIILSSTWRLTVEERRLVDIYLDKIDLKISGYTSDKSVDASGDRPAEILEYININKINQPWIAIDDMDMLRMSDQLNDINFCRTDDRYGLTSEKADEVITKLLNQTNK